MLQTVKQLRFGQQANCRRSAVPFTAGAAKHQVVRSTQISRSAQNTAQAAGRTTTSTISAAANSNSTNNYTEAHPISRFFRAAAAVVPAAVLLLGGAPDVAQASVEKVGEFGASGFVFKDSVEVLSLEDPEVSGITLYIADFKRSIVDKLAKDFFSEPSQASVSCAVTGPVVFKQGEAKLAANAEGEEVFSEAKGFNFFKNKTLRIRRVYDAKHRTILYVAYSTRLSSAADDGNVSSGRYRTSLCTLKVPDAPEVAVNAAQAALAAQN